MTNETFTSAFCDLAPFFYVDNPSIVIYNDNCSYVLLPPCLSNFTVPFRLTAFCVVVGSFNWPAYQAHLYGAYFTPGVTDSSTSGAPTAPVAGSVMDGFDADGKLDWAELNTIMPNLTSLQVVGNLRGTLPNSLPSLLTNLLLQADFSGTIPSTLLSGLSGALDVALMLNNNNLTGTIPDTLLETLGDCTSLTLSLVNSGLSGSLPPTLFAPLTSLQYLYVYLNGNSFNGTIPASFLPRSSLFRSFNVDLSSNQLEGSIPVNFTSGVLHLASSSLLTLKFAHNNLSGSLPACLLPDGVPSQLSALTVDLSYNRFSGTIPSGFLTCGLTANATANTELYLQNNLLEGSVPDDLFYTNATLQPNRGLAPNTRYLLYVNVGMLNFASNRFSGSVPYSFLRYGTNSLTVDLSSNQLSGETTELATAVAYKSHYFILYNNSLSGSLPACTSLGMSIDLSYNKFTGSLPLSWYSCMPNIRVAGNQGLNGTILPALFHWPNLYTLNVSYTGITGELPSNISANIQLVDMRGTTVNFCSATSNMSFASFSPELYGNPTTCRLDETSACDCIDAYPSVCTQYCGTTPPPFETPVQLPSPAPTTQPETSSPPTPPSTTPFGCHGTAPSSAFHCEGGTWKAVLINATALVLPAGVGTVLITGNLTSTSVIINGIGSSVEVGGCITSLSDVHVDLSKSELDSILTSTRYSLVSTSSDSGCSTDFDTVALSVTSSDGGCRKVKVMKTVATTPSGGSTLGALFTIDKSSCNTWWIILVSVVCGVIVVAVIVIVLLAVFWPAFREKIRPYSRARKTRQAVA